MFSYILSVFSHLINVILGIGTPQNFPPPLSAAEERELFLRFSGGDGEARQKLILHNLRLVAHMVRKYYSSNKNQDDLLSVGTIGLVKAVDSFKIENGTRFATYGAKCIQNEILMYLRSQKKQSCEVSINETIDVDRDGNPLTYMDVISSDECLVEEVDIKIRSAKALDLVNNVLSERERRIIVMRYGLGGIKPMTQREVAEKLGISRSYVSRIEKGALERLRAGLE
jgi:RNA polymerase sporulation-specific sigma factor